MRVCDVKETESELIAGEGLGSATLEDCKCIHNVPVYVCVCMMR